jgi:hypothetical protein
MPAKSKKQYNFMKMVAAGKIKSPGLSKEIAKEFASYGPPTEKNKKKNKEKEKKALREIYTAK